MKLWNVHLVEIKVCHIREHCAIPLELVLFVSFNCVFWSKASSIVFNPQPFQPSGKLIRCFPVFASELANFDAFSNFSSVFKPQAHSSATLTILNLLKIKTLILESHWKLIVGDIVAMLTNSTDKGYAMR